MTEHIYVRLLQDTKHIYSCTMDSRKFRFLCYTWMPNPSVKKQRIFPCFFHGISPVTQTSLRKVVRLGFGLSPETIIALCFMLEYHVGVFEGRLTGKNVGFCVSTKRTTTHDAWMSFRKPPSWFRENIWANLYSRHPLLWKDLIQEIFRNNGFSTSIHSLKEYFVLLFYYWTFN